MSFPVNCHFEQEKRTEIFFFFKIPKQKVSPWGQCGHTKVYAPHSPQDPTERERWSQPCREHPLAAGGGCPAPGLAPGVAAGQGSTQPHAALAPKATSLGITLWHCHPKPITVLSCQCQHPEPPQSRSAPGKTHVCSLPHRSPGQVMRAPRAGDSSRLACISSRAIPSGWRGPALARKARCVSLVPPVYPDW